MHIISYILVYARKMRPSSLACDDPFLCSQTLEISLGYHGKRSRCPGAGAHFPVIFCEHFHQPLCRAFLWIGFTGTADCIEAEIGGRLPRSAGRPLARLGWGGCRHGQFIIVVDIYTVHVPLYRFYILTWLIRLLFLAQLNHYGVGLLE